MIWIGIDCGEHTGLAVWDSAQGKFLRVETRPLYRALEIVRNIHRAEGQYVRVIFEDARQRKYLPRERNAAEYRGKLMGAGSVKRDARIWEEFLTDYHIPFEAVPPRAGLTKWDPEHFATVTGWTGRTSKHARDAALLVFQR